VKRSSAQRESTNSGVVACRWILSSFLLIACVDTATTFGADPAETTADTSDDNAPQAAESQRAAVNSNFRHDATLRGVHFGDQSTGWAVGDRGVIWHTNDGGATWDEQPSGVACTLNSVYFGNAQVGWAVGGESQAFAESSRGVVLRTIDGGQTWSTATQNPPPRLRSVKFFDRDHGIATGDNSATAPSGAFVTNDGGTTWNPLPADRVGVWLTGDFLDAETGAVAGPMGQFATLARHRIVPSPLATSSMRSFHAMKLIAPTSGWIAGDGGLVLMTKDLGYSWQTPPADLPEGAEQFDFYAVAAVGERVWLAGSPGTHAFFSPDSGQSWHALPTGLNTPIRALTFVDANRGWAVGELGQILATNDGGRSWTSQRSGGRRAALLGVFASEKDVPLEALADVGAADGYITAIELLHKTSWDSDIARTQGYDDRGEESMLLAGAAAANSAWRFPLEAGADSTQAADLLERLNREHDGRAVELIERHIVRSVRMWRPEVVVTHASDVDQANSPAAVLVPLLLRSIEAAADPAQYSEPADGGLPPWQVKKVYGLLPNGSHGIEAVDANRFSPWLGSTLRDYVQPGRALAGQPEAPAADTLQFELTLKASDVPDTGRGIFGGITLAHGSEARRPQLDPPTGDIVEAERSATRRRHIEALLARSESNAAWAAQIGEITAGLRPADGAELLNQLADGYREVGRLDLAADTFYTLARRYPDQPLADRATQWLVHFYASSEMGYRLTSRRLNDIRQTSATDPPQASPPTAGLSRDERLRRSVQMVEYMKSARLAQYNEPAIRFAEVAAQRQLGFANPAKRYYLTLQQLPETDPWRRCAQTEQWLSQPSEQPPTKTLGACRPALERPLLDAELNDELWNTADRLKLRPASGDSRAPSGGEIRFSYAAEFLYVAIRCERAADFEYVTSDDPRPRDADLSNQDRITIRLDVDRDYTTAFELSVDSRGWTHDSCWGDNHWNPTWYVAAASDEKQWIVEAAIPLAELVRDPPAARSVWAGSAVRTVSGQGHQSWPTGGVADTPDQFGLLLFE
jgi:photosystem II stability/assembly factor-like uncharacterized protein